MPVKIRLSRKGSKKFPFYHIIIADSRAPRDGRFIERLGFYNPNTNPATIEINFEKALEWLQKGAQPTDTCRAILSYKGILIKKHLLEGVKKGALTEDEAESKFNTWLEEKEAKIQAKKDRIVKGREEKLKKRLEAESKIREARAVEIARKTSELAEEKGKTEMAEATTDEANETDSEITVEKGKEKSSTGKKSESEKAELNTEGSSEVKMVEVTDETKEQKKESKTKNSKKKV
jgi:small subunit ribosomal protein S16